MRGGGGGHSNPFSQSSPNYSQLGRCEIPPTPPADGGCHGAAAFLSEGGGDTVVANVHWRDTVVANGHWRDTVGANGHWRDTVVANGYWRDTVVANGHMPTPPLRFPVSLMLTLVVECPDTRTVPKYCTSCLSVLVHTAFYLLT
jgi:hypothetical protein